MQTSGQDSPSEFVPREGNGAARAEGRDPGRIRELEGEIQALGLASARRGADSVFQQQLTNSLVTLARERAREVERINLLLQDTVAEIRMRKERMAGIVHDLKVPITISLLNLELAEMEGNQEERESYLVSVRRELEFLLDTIGNLLDLEQAEGDGTHLRLQPHNLNDLVNEVIGRMRVIIRDKPGLSIQSKLPAKIPAVVCDRQKIVRVFNNLLSNAIKYTETGSITVGRRRGTARSRITVYVKDTGQGIEPDRLPRLFRFFEGDDLRQESSGVGLALVRQVVMAHGGRVWLESTRDVGTTVFVELPLEAATS